MYPNFEAFEKVSIDASSPRFLGITCNEFEQATHGHRMASELPCQMLKAHFTADHIGPFGRYEIKGRVGVADSPGVQRNQTDREIDFENQ
jgi:hypothetical protein